MKGQSVVCVEMLKRVGIQGKERAVCGNKYVRRKVRWRGGWGMTMSQVRRRSEMWRWSHSRELPGTGKSRVGEHVRNVPVTKGRLYQTPCVRGEPCVRG